MVSLDQKEQSFHKSVGEIFTEQLSKGATIRMIIQGQSMSPFLKKGDTVTIKPIVFKKTRIGDIIAYRREQADSSLTLHRLLKKIKGSVVTKGDANRHGDPPISAEKICGKVIKIERSGKTKNLETISHRLSAYLIVHILWGTAAMKDIFSKK